MKSELQPSNLVICGADGKNLDVSGEGTMEITLGPLKVTHEVVVAALQPDAILGMDFLSQHECKVDIPAQRLIINSLVVNLWQEGNNPQSCKVAVKEPVIIPPESEKLILGQVQRRGSEGPVNMVQGSAKFVGRYGLFVCHSLMDVEKGVVPIRILIYLFIWGFYVTFNTVQVISRRVVGRAEETSTYSSLGFCTVNCRPTASNYQLSHLRP